VRPGSHWPGAAGHRDDGRPARPRGSALHARRPDVSRDSSDTPTATSFRAHEHRLRPRASGRDIQQSVPDRPGCELSAGPTRGDARAGWPPYFTGLGLLLESWRPARGSPHREARHGPEVGRGSAAEGVDVAPSPRPDRLHAQPVVVLARALVAHGVSPRPRSASSGEHTEKVKPPRATLCAFPFGHALGRPDDPELQQSRPPRRPRPPARAGRAGCCAIFPRDAEHGDASRRRRRRRRASSRPSRLRTTSRWRPPRCAIPQATAREERRPHPAGAHAIRPTRFRGVVRFWGVPPTARTST